MKLISLEQAATMLGLSIWTVRKWALGHRIPSVRLGRRRLIDADDVVRLVEAGRVPVDCRVALPGGCDADAVHGHMGNASSR